jgi:hypothetical protein
MSTAIDMERMERVRALWLWRLHNLPTTLPAEGSVRLELEEGVPIFRASTLIQERIEQLLAKQGSSPLSKTEQEELDQYEDIDDFLSFVNRTVRNLMQNPRNQQG